MTLTLATNALLAVAVLLNLYAFLRHERARRRLQARVFQQHRQLCEAMPAIAFVAYMTQPESGADERLQAMAREALPESVRIDVEREPPPSGHVH